MMVGKITAEQEAVIELEVIGVNRPENIAAIIDTGFVGMALLKDNRLTLDVVTDGAVTIEALP